MVASNELEGIFEVRCEKGRLESRLRKGNHFTHAVTSNVPKPNQTASSLYSGAPFGLMFWPEFKLKKSRVMPIAPDSEPQSSDCHLV
jgi:hypothetical protein